MVLSGRVTVSTTYSQYNFPRFQNLKCQKSEHNTARVLTIVKTSLACASDRVLETN